MHDNYIVSSRSHGFEAALDPHSDSMAVTFTVTTEE
jgi:hypothetical protein